MEMGRDIRYDIPLVSRATLWGLGLMTLRVRDLIAAGSLVLGVSQAPLMLTCLAACILRMLSARMQNPASSLHFQLLFLCVCFLWLLQGAQLFISAACVLLRMKEEGLQQDSRVWEERESPCVGLAFPKHGPSKVNAC